MYIYSFIYLLVYLYIVFKDTFSSSEYIVSNV
jgi:hypothetical protein